MYPRRSDGEREWPSTPGTIKGVLPDHVERYALASSSKHHNVLDVACGSGYGCLLLQYDHYVGVDYSQECISYASSSMPRDNRTWHLADVTGSWKPCDDRTFDLVVSFETIEHLPRGCWDKFIKDLADLSTTGAALILSCPTRKVAVRSPQIYHQHEPDLEELLSQMSSHWNIVDILFQPEGLPGLSRELTGVSRWVTIVIGEKV